MSVGGGIKSLIRKVVLHEINEGLIVFAVLLALAVKAFRAAPAVVPESRFVESFTAQFREPLSDALIVEFQLEGVDWRSNLLGFDSAA